MTDLAKTILAKSDQLNADDLLAGPITVTITDVRGLDSADQPIAISYEGDSGKPYKPCKSMRRVLVGCWGPDGKTYAGKRMTLYCDPNVQFGGIKVGGIRISHLSHIDREKLLSLNVTRGKKAPYKVLPLRADVRQGPAGQQRQHRDDSGFPGDREAGGFSSREAVEETSQEPSWADRLEADLQSDAFRSLGELNAFTDDGANRDEFERLSRADPDRARSLSAAITGRRKALADRERQD